MSGEASSPGSGPEKESLEVAEVDGMEEQLVEVGGDSGG